MSVSPTRAMPESQLPQELSSLGTNRFGVDDQCHALLCTWELAEQERLQSIWRARAPGRRAGTPAPSARDTAGAYPAPISCLEGTWHSRRTPRADDHRDPTYLGFLFIRIWITPEYPWLSSRSQAVITPLPTGFLPQAAWLGRQILVT